MFSALAEPGDLIVTDALTYTGMKAVASILHLRLHGVAMDEEGMLPDGHGALRRNRPELQLSHL